MVTEIQYSSIHVILDRVLRHPLCQGLTLEAAIQHTIDFIGIVGLPKFYQDKETVIDIKDYRGELPCDLISINMVTHKNIPLRSMTDSFLTKSHQHHIGYHFHHHPMDHMHDHGDETLDEWTFRTQGLIIFTSFKCGKIHISYKAIPTDCDGLPLLPDNPTFLKALEEYIKLEYFTILFDMNKITPLVFNNQLLRYYWRVGQCTSEFTIPSVSEMESISNMWNTLIPRTKEFYKRFRTLGDNEFLRRH